MDLHDLPIDILLKVLPIQQNLLNFPRQTIISWLNLLPQKQSFCILANTGVGLHEAYDAVNGVIYVRTMSGMVRLVKITMAERLKLNDTFRFFVFINFGPSVGKKYLNKYLIFDFQRLGAELLFENFSLFHFICIWAGNDGFFICPWIHFMAFKLDHQFPTDIKVSCPTLLESNKDFGSLFSNSLLRHNSVIGNLFFATRQELFRLAKIVKVNMTVGQYVKFVKHMQNSCSRSRFCPHTLSVRIAFEVIGSNSQPSSSSSLSVQTRNKVDDNYPADFPSSWINQVFNLSVIKSFTLHFLAPSTQISQLASLLYNMPKLTSLDLSFDNLDVLKIPEMIRPKRESLNIRLQMNFKHCFFQSHSWLEGGDHWSVSIKDDYVILNYANEPRTQNKFFRMLMFYKYIQFKSRRRRVLKRALK
ncbi:hypothetical protein KGF57_002072 [Candida theae]|uniref:Uncharacterized protein n=1 Tax=Candida theae TaxID=1198502 RepID=A0AAD5FZD2_9ASCO|nr:uncharacterized protein KGF57_002072 [Candida theae]KAI5959547.1 hypothetical protein KGF57_002072 [Candida theae]